jgi:diguanylate cyclase (GGDEF)-like protein
MLLFHGLLMPQMTADVLFEINQAKCVSCLACVRACPAEAISVNGGQVQVVDESCIKCGACVPACPHDAVDVMGDLGKALELSARGDSVLLLSVEAEVFFHPHRPEQVINACYRAGFEVVQRGVIGDELVAAEYQRLWSEGGWETMIRSTCPIVVNTIRHNYPDLVPYLAPVKNPVAAEAEYIRERYGSEIGIVYAGVCLADGGEKVDAVITLEELAKLFGARQVKIEDQPAHFNRIPEERRRHISVAGGLPKPLLAEESQASRRFRKVRKDMGQLATMEDAIHKGLDLGFVDILPCEGCLDHPLMGPREELYTRRNILTGCEPPRSPDSILDPTVSVEVVRDFQPVQNGDAPSEIEVSAVIDRIGRAPEGKPWDCGACGFTDCAGFAAAFIKGRATYRQCPPYQEQRAVKAQEEAAIDELTGLATYRVLRERLRNEIARSGRTGEQFAVLFADLDRFKQVNDLYGHEAGNRVLRATSDVLRGVVRSSDIAARYGGDEFVVVLIGTNIDGARRVGEEVRRAIEVAGRENGFPDGAVSVSIGVTEFEKQAKSDSDVLEAADRALYKAKAAGGNLVI